MKDFGFLKFYARGILWFIEFVYSPCKTNFLLFSFSLITYSCGPNAFPSICQVCLWKYLFILFVSVSGRFEPCDPGIFGIDIFELGPPLAVHSHYSAAIPGPSDLGNALYSLPPPASRATAPSPGFHRQHLVLFKNVTFFHSLF